MDNKKEIDRLCKEFFDLFTNAGGRQPQLERVYDLVLPATIIIKKDKDTEEIYTLAAFIEPRKKILTDGTLTGFSEWETAEHTSIDNNIAQRRSEYKKEGVLNGMFFKQEGIKLFQFIKTAKGWQITAVMWEDK
ncbi:MAG: hypothetical protein QM791_23500 [Ferruginibacter sp.]